MKTTYKTTDELLDNLTDGTTCAQVCAQKIFSKTSMRLVDASSEDDIFQIIGEGLRELMPDSMVFINSFDETSGLFHLRAMISTTPYVDKVAKILGAHPIGIPISINAEARRELASGTLKRVPGGLFALAMGTVPEPVCKTIEKLLNVNEVYAIGFTWQERLFGSANLLLHKSTDSLDYTPIKAFVSLASIALQRWQAENALRKSEQKNKELVWKYNELVQASTDIIFTVDLQGNFSFANKATYTQLGYSESEIKGINGFQLVHPDDIDSVRHTFASLLKGENIENIEYRYKKKDGSYIHILTSACPIFDSNENVAGALGIARNISERKKLEKDLRDHRDNLEKVVSQRTQELELVNRKLQQELAERKRAEEETRQSVEQLQNLMVTAPVMVCRIDLKSKIIHVNKKFEEVTGYSAEEVVGKYWPVLGLISPDITGALINRMMEKLLGKAPTPMEISIKCKDGQSKYISGVGEVVKDNGKPAGFQVIAQDITERKKAEQEAEQSTRRLLKALEDIIQAMAMTVELRDPYTAGHQRRVAQLASVIANDMGLPEEQLVGIRLAGLVHDIGKIRVPAEILTHPNGLTEAELNIIRMHPVVGFELLKGIEFPWPIAQAVVQHHERLDGSGYPSGILSTEIIIEAKILAVADVVEAMASHRPYRPGLGINRAFEEILGNSGKLFDAAVVDSCLRVFQKKGFKFEEPSKDKVPHHIHPLT